MHFLKAGATAWSHGPGYIFLWVHTYSKSLCHEDSRRSNQRDLEYVTELIFLSLVFIKDWREKNPIPIHSNEGKPPKRKEKGWKRLFRDYVVFYQKSKESSFFEFAQTSIACFLECISRWTLRIINPETLPSPLFLPFSPSQNHFPFSLSKRHHSFSSFKYPNLRSSTIVDCHGVSGCAILRSLGVW